MRFNGDTTAHAAIDRTDHAATYVVRPRRDALEHRGRSPGRRRGLDGARRAQSRPRHGSAATRFVDPDQLRAGWRLRLPVGRARPTIADVPDATARAPRRRSRSDPTTCPNWSPSASARWPAPRWPAGPAGAATGAPFTGDLDLGRPLSDEARGRGDPAAALRRASRRCGPSRPPTACWAGPCGTAASGPTVRAICVSPSGVTFWFAGAHPDAPPDGFTAVHGRQPHGTSTTTPSRANDPFVPYVPVVLPVGDDDEGTWLVPLGPGDVLPAPRRGGARPLWRAARAAVGSWAWSDTILVTEDPDDPGLRSEAAADPFDALGTLLFFGDPADAAPEVGAARAPWSPRPRSPPAT